MKGVVVRAAAPDEAERIAAVLLAAFIEYESLYTAEAFASTTPGAAQVERRMDEGPVWVTVVDDVIEGTLAAVKKNAGLYLRGMGVVPQARGAGQGNLLLRTAENFANENELPRLFLSTTPFLDRAIHLYEAYGFKKTSEGPYWLFGTPLFTMEKLLID